MILSICFLLSWLFAFECKYSNDQIIYSQELSIIESIPNKFMQNKQRIESKFKIQISPSSNKFKDSLNSLKLSENKVLLKQDSKEPKKRDVTKSLCLNNLFKDCKSWNCQEFINLFKDFSEFWYNSKFSYKSPKYRLQRDWPLLMISFERSDLLPLTLWTSDWINNQIRFADYRAIFNKDSLFSELNQMEITERNSLELSSNLVQVSLLGDNRDNIQSIKDLDGIVVTKDTNINDNLSSAQFSQSKGYFDTASKQNLIYWQLQYYKYIMLFLVWSWVIIWNQIFHIQKWLRLNETHLSFVSHLALDICHTLFYSIPLFYPLRKYYIEKSGDFEEGANFENEKNFFELLLVYIFTAFALVICQRVLYFKFKEIYWWFKLLILFWTIYFALGIFKVNLFIWILKFGVPNSLLFCSIIWNIISRKTVCESWRSIFWKLLLFYVSPMTQHNNFYIKSPLKVSKLYRSANLDLP